MITSQSAVQAVLPSNASSHLSFRSILRHVLCLRPKPSWQTSAFLLSCFLTSKSTSPGLGAPKPKDNSVRLAMHRLGKSVPRPKWPNQHAMTHRNGSMRHECPTNLDVQALPNEKKQIPIMRTSVLGNRTQHGATGFPFVLFVLLKPSRWATCRFS